MEEVPVKITGGSLSALEFSSGTSQEVQNVVLQTGQVLTGADLTQLGKAVAIYANGADFYTDSGSANTIVLDVVGLKKSPPAYFNGQRVVFVVGNANTGATTINVDSVGAVALTRLTSALASGFLSIGDVVEARYDGTAFEVMQKGKLTGIDDTSTGVVLTLGDTTMAVGVNINFDGNFIESLADKTFPGSLGSDGGFRLFASTVSGGVWYGRGSTNDISVLNKDGTTVIAVPTGTQDIIIQKKFFMDNLQDDPTSINPGSAFLPNAGASQLTQFTNTTANANIQQFGNPNGIGGGISISGTTTAFLTTSDERLKSEFETTSDPRLMKDLSDDMPALKMVVDAFENKGMGKFYFLKDEKKTEIWGYKAHWVIDNQPGFGGSEGNGPRDAIIGDVYDTIEHPAEMGQVAIFDKDGKPTGKTKEGVVKKAWVENLIVTPAGIDQSKRVPLLEAAIYELLKKVEALEAK